jgi:hypothetical protein
VHFCRIVLHVSSTTSRDFKTMSCSGYPYRKLLATKFRNYNLVTSKTVYSHSSCINFSLLFAVEELIERIQIVPSFGSTLIEFYANCLYFPSSLNQFGLGLLPTG